MSTKRTIVDLVAGEPIIAAEGGDLPLHVVLDRFQPSELGVRVGQVLEIFTDQGAE